MKVQFKSFGSTDETITQHDGKRGDAVPMDEANYDLSEIGPMFVVTFEDGTTCDAFEDELTVLDCTPENGHMPGADHRWQECPTYHEDD